MFMSIRRGAQYDRKLWYKFAISHRPLRLHLELLFFLEEHTETDDGAIDEEAADNTHHHGGDRYDLRVCQDDWQYCKEMISNRNLP